MGNVVLVLFVLAMPYSLHNLPGTEAAPFTSAES